MTDTAPNNETSHPLEKLLTSKSIKCYVDIDIRTVSLFDDDYYSNIDYDFVSNNFRSLIRVILKKEGFLEKTSRRFIQTSNEIDAENKLTLSFPKPPHTLGADPSDNVIEELKKSDFVFATPTQTLLVMAKNNVWSQETALKLIEKCPANIDKIFQWLNELNLLAPTKEQLSELKTLQEKNFKKKVVRYL